MGITKPRRQIPGVYFAGVVERTGPDVTRLIPGQRVFGAARLRMGAYAEYVCLPESYTIVTMPENMTFAEAAAVPLGGLNALHYMRRADIREGEKVLVNGAGGSIGLFAVQIAKAMGAEVTAVDCAAKEAMLRGIGADHFMDYRRGAFTRTGGKYDVIFSIVAGAPYAECISALEPGGRYLMANPYFIEMLRSVLTTRLTDKKVIFAFAGERLEELTALKEMIEAGTIRSVVDRVYPLEHAAGAHTRVETEQRLGCVVIDAGGEGQQGP
jgi:NADPH:quinone reductase-like Zn-dependent oxidoreductase